MSEEINPTAESIPTTEQIRDFVVAAHGNLPRVRELLTEQPGLLNARYEWAEDDWETAIQAAAQVGSTAVVEYLLARGAPLEICTAAMLGRLSDVKQMLDKDPGLIKARGAHGIYLLSHAALSNKLPLVKMLYERGAIEGTSLALGNAIMHGHFEMAKWLIENGHPELNWKNYEGKSLLTLASERGDKGMLTLLQEHGAV
jgi:ankyrin repeat protein